MQRIFFTTNVLSGDNLLFSLTAILCEVILFCRHDLRRKTLHVSDASKVAKTKNCCEPNSVFCHSANRALVQWCSMTKSFINPSLGNFAKKCVLNLVKPFSGHFRAIKSQNLLKSHLQVVHFTAFWSRCKILACRFRACAESKILRAVTVKVFTVYCCYTVTQQSWLLLFTFSPLLFFCFSGQLNFFFCWAFSRLHFGGKGY